MWTCVYCEKNFKTNNGLLKHVRKLHLLYRCTTCNEDFSTKKERNRHERSHPTSQLIDTTGNQLSDAQQIRNFTGLHQEDLANAVCSSFNFLEGGRSGSLTQNDPDSDCEILFSDFDVNQSLTNIPDPAQSIDSNWNHVNIVKADIPTIKDFDQEGHALTSDARPFTTNLNTSLVNSLNDYQFSTPYNSSIIGDKYSRIESNTLDFTRNDVSFCSFDGTPVSSSLDVNKSLTNKPDPAQSIDSNWNHGNIVKADIIHTIKDSVQEGNSLTSDAKPFTAKLDSSSVAKSLNDHQFSTPYNSSVRVDDSRIKSTRVHFTSNDVPSVQECIISRSSCGMVKNIKTNSTEQKHASEDVASSSSAYSWNNSIKKSNNEQKSGIPEWANVCSISPKIHAKSDNTSSGDQVMDFRRDFPYLLQKGSSKTNEDSSSKPNKDSFKMNKAKWLTKKGNFLLGGILGCKVKKTQSAHYDSRGTNLGKLSSTESKNKESALSRPLGKCGLDSCNNHSDLICKAQEDTGKSNLHFRLCSNNEKKEMEFTSSSSDDAGNKIKNFELAENNETLVWGEVAAQSHADEISLSEEMKLLSTLKGTEKSKNKKSENEKSAHKGETSMDYSPSRPSSSSKYNFPKDSIMQHAISLRHFLWELAFCTETELKLMLKFVMTKDVELAVQLNSLKMLPFPKFPHHIPRLYIDFLKKAFKKEVYGGVVKSLEDLISPYPEIVIKQAEKIDPIILTEREREEEMRKAVLTVLDFQDLGADKPVQDIIIGYLDLFLVELCMNLKKCENEEDPLSAAFPPGIRSVKDVQDFYVSNVIEGHAFSLHGCLGRYKTFLLHRKFIEKKTTDWLKKKGKFVSSQVSKKNSTATSSAGGSNC